MIKLVSLFKEEIHKVSSKGKKFILPTDVYYIDDNNRSELYNIGFKPGSVINEAEVVLILWGEYQTMQEFGKESNIGSPTINKMKDINFNIPKINVDSMFFTQLVYDIMDDFTVYANKGDEYEIIEEYTINNNKILACIDNKTGNDFDFNKTLNDKYQYMLIDDDEFKEFAETIKHALT